MRRIFALAAALLVIAVLPAYAGPKRNVVIFVADGLRYDSVTPETAPTMAAVKAKGVDFADSHAMYPTLTTVNAASIASGHYPGDTGDYANALYVGFPVPCGFGPPDEIAGLEDDCVLAQMKAHFGGGYMGQTTLIAAARAAGFNTAIVGKTGPAAIQWIDALKSQDDGVSGPYGVFIDDATNHPKRPDGTATGSTVLHNELASDIFAATGLGAPPFSATPNLPQQAYMAAATAQVLIPELKNAGKPFVLLFWSRDPDATQHAATDSEGKLVPGINSIDAHAAIYNADSDLKSILDALRLAGLDSNTDVFVTADHGFSTIARGVPDADGSFKRGTLGFGFVAVDVANWLGQNIYEPGGAGAPLNVANGERPHGDALIGPSPDKPSAVVVADGGSDLIYVPEGPNRAATVARVFAGLASAPYIGALFVNDALMKDDPKAFAGALPMSAIDLIGAATVPQPAIIVGFRSFVVKGCKLDPLLCTAEAADTTLDTGQGMHGSFSRADTRNFMAAMGPDFKARFKDSAPASNADIAPTLAHILGLALSGPGALKGRVAAEALKGGKMPPVSHGWRASDPGPGGIGTVLEYQQVGGTRYFDAGGIPGRTVGLIRR